MSSLSPLNSAFASIVLAIGLLAGCSDCPDCGDQHCVEDASTPSDVAADLVSDVAPDVAFEVNDEVSDVSIDNGSDVTGPQVTGAPWTKIVDTTFLRGPFVQMAGTDTATIVWRTATLVGDEGCVDYRNGDIWESECAGPDRNGQYEVLLTGLPPESEIVYLARTGDLKTVEMSFRTMPDVPKPMKILVYADAHNTPETLMKMSDYALAAGVDFGICVGDIASTPTDEEYNQYFDGVRALASRVNLWVVPGNHDDHDILKFFESFVLPKGSSSEDDIASGYAEGYWDRRLGNVWIGGGWVRDFYLSAPDSDWGEVGFFRQRFQSPDYQTADWKLFFIHQPAWVVEWPGCDYKGEECLKTAMIPMAKEAGIDATFHGHMHGVEYGVVDGVNTFVIGGVGGDLDPGECALPADWPAPWTRSYGAHSFAIVETGEDLTVEIVRIDDDVTTTVRIPRD